MEKTRFNLPIWTVPPFSSNIMSNWYNGERGVKELILKNSITNELGVSEMNLNIKKFDEALGKSLGIDKPDALVGLQYAFPVQNRTAKHQTEKTQIQIRDKD